MHGHRRGRAAAPARWSSALTGGALLLCALSAPLQAQSAALHGSISGSLVDTAGKSLSYTTIWLVPRDTLIHSSGTLTDSAGGFVFRGLPAGEYYLRVDRVGYRSEWSDPKRLAPGQHMALAVTSAAPPVALGRITAPGGCRSGDAIAADTPLATLLGEARKAAAARRLFDLSYRYGVDVREELALFNPKSDKRHARHLITSEPAQARALAEKGSWGGYGAGMDSMRLVAVQEMLQVLTEHFARAHCLSALADGRGLRQIRFWPLTEVRGVVDMAGTIILDAGYGLSRIEFEYREGGWATSRGYAEFDDGGLEGSPVRFLAKLELWVFDAPASRGDRISLGPGSRGMWQKERARTQARYGPFLRDTTQQ